jgi:anti-sigma factor RsiW
MEPSDRCPDPGTWKTFLDGDLLDEASSDLTSHLETCEACQQTLERLAAGKETWEGTARQPQQDISIGRGCERMAGWILGGWVVAGRVPGVGMAASIKGSIRPALRVRQ